MSYFKKSNLKKNFFSTQKLVCQYQYFDSSLINKVRLWRHKFFFLGDTRNFAISARSSAFFANMKTLLEWMDSTYFYRQDCFKFTTESMLKLK